MKKGPIGFVIAIIIGISAYCLYNLNLNPEVAQAAKNSHFVVNTYKDELHGGTSGNSLAVAIYKAHSFTDYNVNHPNLLGKTVLKTIIDYDKDALKFANKVNASKVIKEQLSQAIKLSEQSLSELDSGKLINADEILTNLNKSYNSGNTEVLSKAEIKNGL